MKCNKLFNRIFVSFLTVFLLILNINFPVKAEEPLNNENTVETLEQEEDYYPNEFIGPEYDPAYYEMMNYDDEINTVNTIATYTVKYDGNDATSGSTANTTHTNGDESTLAMNGFKKKGYLFEGWNTRKDGFGETYKEGQKVSNLSSVDGDVVTLYATWSIESDTFEFTIPSDVVLKNDGKGNLSGNIPISVTTKQRRWVDVSVNSKNNFKLVESNGSTIPYNLSDKNLKLEPQYRADDTYSSNKNISINASESGFAGDYVDNVSFNIDTYHNTRTIQLDCNGGNVNGQSTVVYTVADGASYGKLPIPVAPKGYNFYGWQDESGNIIYSGSKVKPNTEKLVCKWIIRSYLDFDGLIDGNLQNGQYYVYFNVYIDDKLIIENDSLFDPTLTQYVGHKIKITVNHVVEGFEYLGTTQISNGLKQFQDENGQFYIEGILGEGGTRVVCKIETKQTFSFKKITEETNCDTVIFDTILPSNIVTQYDLTSEFKSTAKAYVKNNELHIGNPSGKVQAPTDCSKMFLNCSKLIKIDLTGLDTSESTILKEMFKSCINLKEINVNVLNVEEVINIGSMFEGCINIEFIDIVGWKTTSLKTFDNLFHHCHKLKNINGIGKLDISNVIRASNVFQECWELENVDLSNWDVSNVTNFYYLFGQCYQLKTVNISGWKTSSLTSFNTIFTSCKKLEEIVGIEDLDMSKVKSISYLFSSCLSLNPINLNKWDTSNLQNVYDTFSGLKWEKIDISNWKTNNIKNTGYMFSGNVNLKNIYVSKDFLIDSITDSYNMFLGCTSLVGGAGTAYDPTFTDATAARIDGGPNNPGYFTDIKDKQVNAASFDETLDKAPLLTPNEDIKLDTSYTEDSLDTAIIEDKADTPIISEPTNSKVIVDSSEETREPSIDETNSGNEKEIENNKENNEIGVIKSLINEKKLSD